MSEFREGLARPSGITDTMKTPETNKRVWILGAPDPEMEEIERILLRHGELLVYATADGARVHPGNAYRADCPLELQAGEGEAWTAVYRVECAWDHSYESLAAIVQTIDHHLPGHPGFGRPPDEFLTASSIGQVLAELARLRALFIAPPVHAGWRTRAAGDIALEHPRHPTAPNQYVVAVGSGDGCPCVSIPQHLVLTAAADHCLGAAYRGECPGVDPDELGHFRAVERARFQSRFESGVTADVILSRIADTSEVLRSAPELVLEQRTVCPWHEGRPGHGGDCQNAAGTEYADEPCSWITVRDMRSPEPHPELPEAATRMGIGYVSGPIVSPDGRSKFTCSGTAAQVRAFLTYWAPSEELVDCYGDPARGFAGGYAPAMSESREGLARPSGITDTMSKHAEHEDDMLPVRLFLTDTPVRVWALERVGGGLICWDGTDREPGNPGFVGTARFITREDAEQFAFAHSLEVKL